VITSSNEKKMNLTADLRNKFTSHSKITAG